MDTFIPDAPTPLFATRRTLRRWAATAASTGGLIAIAAAAYATLRPATVASAAVPVATPVQDHVMPNVAQDTVTVLQRTFAPSTMPTTAPSTMPSSTSWLSLFGTSDEVATSDTSNRSAVSADVDAAARPAGVTVDEDDLVWTPTTATTPSTTAATPGNVVADDAAANDGPAPIVNNGLSEDGRLAITVNRTAEIRTNVPIRRVSIGQPEIADVQPMNPNLILVTAKKPGVTQVIIWDDQDRSQSIDVNVEIPLEQLRDMVGRLAPGSNIEVGVAADTIILRGQAPNLTVAKQIGDVAGAFGRVQNFIEVAGTQTVAVQVQFAEVSRNVTNSLAINWGFQDGVSIFGAVPGGNGPLSFATEDSVVTGLGVVEEPTAFDFFGVGRAAGNPFAYFIKALRENNMLRMLQEPTLTTTSGEPANFLAGGEVAIPVPADNGTIGIEYKQYGVRLKITPIVLGNGRIRLVMEAESSELDYAAGTRIQAASVPGLRTRRVSNTVEIGEGQTMSVAGLLDDMVVASKQQVPGLGDLPIVGQLFRSTRYQRRETELVILITPRLTGAMNPDQVPPLPGANWRHPSELEQFALGDMGGNEEADAVRDWNRPASERGLRGTETQRLNPSNEPAAQTRLGGPQQPSLPPRFFGEHGFSRAADEDATTSARD